MTLPEDVVLDGYTLIEQHEVDHEFLFAGSPLSSSTPLLLVLTVAGIFFVAVGIITLILGSTRRALLSSALFIGAILSVSKLWWMPISTMQQFDDGQVFWYTLRYYTGYWAGPSAFVIAVAAIGIIGAIFALVRKKS